MSPWNTRAETSSKQPYFFKAVDWNSHQSRHKG